MNSTDSGDRLRVCDPACGSGRMLLAYSRTHLNRQNDHYTAIDIDRRCVKMCVVNFVMHGLSGVVIHGDTLRLEAWGGFRTIRAGQVTYVATMSKEQAEAILRGVGASIADGGSAADGASAEEVPGPVEQEAPGEAGQLTLFT